MTENGPRVVAMGDSVTFGVGDGLQWPDGTSGWAGHVATSLGARHYVNIAHNGVRARHLMASQVPVALKQDPDVVLMTVGGNDVLRGDFSPQEIQCSLTDVFRRLDRPHRDVVVVTLDQIGVFRAIGRRVQGIMARRIAETNHAIMAACEGTSVRVVDGADVFGAVGPRAWHVDKVHPSQVGHRAIASRAVDALALKWPRVAEPAPARPAPAWAMRATWLTVYGLPWVAKRSIDFVPDLAEVVRSEMRSDRQPGLREYA